MLSPTPPISPSSRSAIIASSCASKSDVAPGAGHPQVHRVEPLDVQGAQVVQHARAQLLRALRRQPAALGVARRADLADQHEPSGYGCSAVAQELVGHVGSVVLRGVDVVDAELDRAPHAPRGPRRGRGAGRRRRGRAAAWRRSRSRWTVRSPSGKVFTRPAYDGDRRHRSAHDICTLRTPARPRRAPTVEVMRVKMILPALTEATSPFFRPIKYSLFPPLGLATLAGYLRPTTTR